MDETIKFGDRLKHAWDVFRLKDNPLDSSAAPSSGGSFSYGVGYTSRPDRTVIRRSSSKTVLSSIYNRIANDVSAVSIRHVRVNQNGNYEESIDSGLNRCLTVEANVDQTGRELIRDAVFSMFDEGSVAIVPVETSISIKDTSSFDILSLRTGRITQWYPRYIRVELYNDKSGMKEEIVLPKSKVAIIENPFYSVVNEPNSTVRRMVDKMNLLDKNDVKTYDSKLDMILQLPYQVRSEAQRDRANNRINDIEQQLQGSKHGIAYVDATEKIVQLNRPIENKLTEQIDKLETKFYGDLGVSRAVFEGTASEQETLNYRNNTLEPILSAIVDEMIRKFLTKTAQTQGQTIKFIQDPFKLVPVNNIADIADKFTRNEVMSPNDVRSLVGLRPVDDERANELRNRNLNVSDEQLANPVIARSE